MSRLFNPTPLTKLLTGMMFACFVDQDLIDINDPMSKFLPDFPDEDDKAITRDQCFTHITVLYCHDEFGGMYNPWLNNIIVNGLDKLNSRESIVNYIGRSYDQRLIMIIILNNEYRISNNE